MQAQVLRQGQELQQVQAQVLRDEKANNPCASPMKTKARQEIMQRPNEALPPLSPELEALPPNNTNPEFERMMSKQLHSFQKMRLKDTGNGKGKKIGLQSFAKSVGVKLQHHDTKKAPNHQQSCHRLAWYVTVTEMSVTFGQYSQYDGSYVPNYK